MSRLQRPVNGTEVAGISSQVDGIKVADISSQGKTTLIVYTRLGFPTSSRKSQTFTKFSLTLGLGQTPTDITEAL